MLVFVCMMMASMIMCGSMVASEPFTLGVSLVFCALMVCMIISKVSSSLLAFLIFMSYVGGVMILFLYVLSVHPNQIHAINVSKIFFVLSFMVVVTISLCWFNEMFFDSISLGNFSFVSMSMFSFLYLFMAVILLYALLVVCYLCMKKRSPLRSI
uniref:NADH dehydrogenase subunit 6 n=1 Tax=Perumytilus purpuratus TaxID=390823 RepID=A0A346KL33_PERPP|nr:NADH dehydrogenase subunit 6 [Perumytilus purpuratus]